MKMMRNSTTGEYLSQEAYDAWLEDSPHQPETVWTQSPDEAAWFFAEDAPPITDGVEVVETV